LNFVDTAAFVSKWVKIVGYLNLVSSVKRIQEAQQWLTDDEKVTLVNMCSHLNDCYTNGYLSHLDMRTQRQVLKTVARNILTRTEQSYYNDPNSHVAMPKHVHDGILRIAYGLRPRYQIKSPFKFVRSQGLARTATGVSSDCSDCISTEVAITYHLDANGQLQQHVSGNWTSSLIWESNPW
jgi:hypothetical protein